MGRPKDVDRTCFLDLHIGLIGASTRDVLKTLVGDVPWRYTKDNMGTSSVAKKLLELVFPFLGSIFLQTKTDRVIKKHP